jgi:hypothetical protein
MKIKGIPFWEQHIEKFILAGFGVVLLGVGAWQVIMRPTHTTFENKPAGPDEVERSLKARADALSAKLAASATSTPLVDGELPLAMKTFPDAIDGGVSPRATLPTIAPSLAAAILPSEAAVDAGRFYEPSMKAPRMVTVRQESDTLDETVLTKYPELADVFKPLAEDPSQARDITWLLPVAEVDVASMRNELRRSMMDKKPPSLAIPALWYNDALWIVDVVFERQERLADGTWSAPLLVDALPTQLSFRKELPKAGIDLRDEMFRLLGQPDKVVEVLQPEFLETKGNTFSAGVVLSATEEGSANVAGESPDLRRLKQTYARRVLERDRTLELVKALGGPCYSKKSEERDRNREEDQDGGGGGGGRAPGGGGLGGGMSGGKNKGGPDKKEDEEKCIRLTRRWEDLNSKIEKLEADIKRLSPAEDLDGKGSGGLDLAKDEKLLVWAHDIWVKPGATYRYTCRIDSYNPFFARKRQLVPDQQDLSDSFLIASATSASSAPVTVEPPVAIFVIDAQANGGKLGLGRARVELYRFFDGVRRLETIEVQPGDRIGKFVERRRDGSPAVDFTTDWFVVDIVDSGTERRSGAKVLLRKIGDTQIIERDPISDESSNDRTRFEDEARTAKESSESKREGAGEAPEGGAEAPRTPGSGGGPGGGLGGR